MGLKSHYQFKKWKWSEQGERVGASPIRVNKELRSTADLINTCYYNPSTKTETAYCLVWDIDAHRAGEEWKDSQGRVCWDLIQSLISKKFPDLLKYIFWVGRSTGGRGLAVCMAIGPLVINKQTASSQSLANIVQRKILELLNHFKIGADPAALGIIRDFPNWFDPNRTVYANLKIFRQVQNKEFREPVLTNVISYLNTLDELKYVKKSDREGLLYTDIRVEKKLAILFGPFLDSAVSCLEWVWSTEDILAETSLSLPTLRKLLKADLSYLKIAKIRKDEWKLNLERPPDVVLRRVSKILDESEGETYQLSLGNISLNSLPAPEKVLDGERNKWLASLAIILKQNGISACKASEALTELVQDIPEHTSSRNCKNHLKIIASIYRNRPELYGQRDDVFPSWLKEVLSTKSRNVPTLDEKKFKKGGYPQGLSESFKNQVVSNREGKSDFTCPKFDFSKMRSSEKENRGVLKNKETDTKKMPSFDFCGLDQLKSPLTIESITHILKTTDLTRKQVQNSLIRFKNSLSNKSKINDPVAFICNHLKKYGEYFPKFKVDLGTFDFHGLDQLTNPITVFSINRVLNSTELSLGEIQESVRNFSDYKNSDSFDSQIRDPAAFLVKHLLTFGKFIPPEVFYKAKSEVKSPCKNNTFNLHDLISNLELGEVSTSLRDENEEKAKIMAMNELKKLCTSLNLPYRITQGVIKNHLGRAVSLVKKNIPITEEKLLQ